MSLKFDGGGIYRNLNRLDPEMNKALTAVTHLHAPRLQAKMKNDAPWQDQTSNARNGLVAKPVNNQSSGTHAIVLYHSVPYGIWLEVRFSGRMAVIVPTIQSEGPAVMATASKVLAIALGKVQAT